MRKALLNRSALLKRSLIILVAGMMATACNDWLEIIPPDGLVQDEYWKTKEDVQAVLMGAYQSFAKLDQKLFLYGEIRGDMVKQDANTAAYQRNIMEGNLYPDNQLANWDDFYSIINYCNFVIEYAPEVREIDPTFSPYQMQGYQTEAIFLRSLAYFYLVRIFKDVPLVLNPTESDDVDLFPAKSTDQEVLSRIKEDLINARLFVRGDYGSPEKNKGRATRGAINSLLADISLWNFEYEDCINYVEEVEKLDYFLMPTGKWFEVYYPGNSLEGIFELQFDNRLGQANSMYPFTYTQRNYLASDFATEILSPERSGEIIRGNGSLREVDGKIWKYCGGAPDGRTLRPGVEARSGNWIIYRYADVLLMKAEALSQSGNYDDALGIINEIRSRALMDPVSLNNSPEAFEDAILLERAREFAFEGKRWFDLLRMGRRNNFARKSKLIEVLIEKVPSTQKLVLASKLSNPFGWYFPIYYLELEKNVSLDQNPYYEAFTTK
jgi:starch-binding outer membrane protein, SusD/RagB family